MIEQSKFEKFAKENQEFLDLGLVKPGDEIIGLDEKNKKWSLVRRKMGLAIRYIDGEKVGRIENIAPELEARLTKNPYLTKNVIEQLRK